jgi:hypothetical protein
MRRPEESPDPRPERSQSGGTLPPWRVREILDRIVTGFYDRAEVVRLVARRVLRDL